MSYQICPLEQKKRTFSCGPVTFASIDKNQEYISLALPNWAFYVRILTAENISKTGTIQAKGFFPEEESCKGFTTRPIVLLQNKRSKIIDCIRT